jgi:hypothetical protein
VCAVAVVRPDGVDVAGDGIDVEIAPGARAELEAGLGRPAVHVGRVVAEDDAFGAAVLQILDVHGIRPGDAAVVRSDREDLVLELVRNLPRSRVLLVHEADDDVAVRSDGAVGEEALVTRARRSDRPLVGRAERGIRTGDLDRPRPRLARIVRVGEHDRRAVERALVQLDLVPAQIEPAVVRRRGVVVGDQPLLVEEDTVHRRADRCVADGDRDRLPPGHTPVGRCRDRDVDVARERTADALRGT